MLNKQKFYQKYIMWLFIVYMDLWIINSMLSHWVYSWEIVEHVIFCNLSILKLVVLYVILNFLS